MKKKLCLLCLCLLMLSGCRIPFADYQVTDEEYYKTHTGTTEESVFQQTGKTTEKGTEQEVSLEQNAGSEQGDESKDDTEDKQNDAAEQIAELDVDITECELRTGVETQAYTDSSAFKKAGIVPADEVLPILAEEQGYFKVSYNGQEIWVNEGQCLVNAKQYIPSLQVNLGMGNNPNFFNIGDVPIPRVTDQLFYTRSGSQDGSEAWMRYAVAKQLRSAQKTFLKDGYSIKIYDAYRPYSVTLAIRDGYSAFLKTDQGKQLRQKYYYNGYAEGYFLAQKVSSHNYGAAVDMTLVEIANDEELTMPSAMHTLDARSGLKSWQGNGTTETSHAQYMREIMVANGFATLESEWWHFQVDTISKTLFDVPN